MNMSAQINGLTGTGDDMLITSKDNELIKEAAKLIQSSKYRREKGLFAAEGVRLCADGVLSGSEAEYFLYTENAAKKYPAEFELISASSKKSFAVSESVFRKISDTTNPQGFFCVFVVLDKSHKLDKINTQGRYAALENIQDPSNLGTILRTAEALGVDGIILSADCCDVYSPKVIRGSMGAVFRVPVRIEENFTGFIRDLSENGIITYASTPHEAEDINGVDFSNGGVMLIGNEGNGLRAETIAACTKCVRINMKGRAESLNAAAAAAILMYKLQG